MVRNVADGAHHRHPGSMRCNNRFSGSKGQLIGVMPLPRGRGIQQALARGGFPMHLSKLFPFAGAVLVSAVVASPSVGYIHFPPTTMPKMCQQSANIRVLAVKVKKYDVEKGAIVFELVETPKGKNPKDKEPGKLEVMPATLSVDIISTKSPSSCESFHV
jgi:hypothetical protein